MRSRPDVLHDRIRMYEIETVVGKHRQIATVAFDDTKRRGHPVMQFPRKIHQGDFHAPRHEIIRRHEAPIRRRAAHVENTDVALLAEDSVQERQELRESPYSQS